METLLKLIKEYYKETDKKKMFEEILIKLQDKEKLKQELIVFNEKLIKLKQEQSKQF